MKSIAKKLLLVGAAVALTASLAGCDALGDNMIKDSQTYVQGMLDKFYKGQYNQEYLELIDLTEEEAAEEYESWVQAEADYFSTYFSIDYPSDEYTERAKDLYRELYALAKYTVKGASKLDSGAYAVEVEVEPMNIMQLVTEDDMNIFWDEASGGKNSSDMTEEEYMAADALYADKILEAVKAQIPNMGYDPAESFVFQLKEDTDGYYALVENDLYTFDSYIIRY